MPTFTYHLPDIKGACCTSSVINAFEDHPELKYCTREVDILEKTLTLFINPKDDRLKHLSTERLHPMVHECLSAVGFDAHYRPNLHVAYAILGLILGFSLVALSIFMPLLPGFAAIIGVSLGLFITGVIGWPFFRRAGYGLKKGDVSMDTLFSMSTILLAGVSIAALFVPGLPLMLEAGLLIFGFRHLGIAISDAFKSTLVSTKKLQDDIPEEVTIIDAHNITKKIASSDIRVGDRLNISQGDILPVDGYYEAGEGLVSNVYQTGQVQPVPLILNHVYPAGTKLEHTDAPLKFIVTTTKSDSFLAKEDRAILAQKLKSKPVNNPLNSVLRWFIPAVLMIALGSALAVGFFFASWVVAIEVMSCVLVAACPCTLGLISPLVTHVGLKKVEQSGIIFKEPDKLSVLNGINAVMFDLNGTLTCGQPQVQDAQNKQDLLKLMAHLESGSHHWVARALEGAVHEKLQAEPCEMIASNRYGLHARFQGDEYHIGNISMVENLKASYSDLDETPFQVELGLGDSAIYLIKNGQYADHIILMDNIRAGAHELIQKLQTQHDCKVFMCTGSDKKVANSFANALNIPKSHVFSECSIEDKKNHLKTLKAQGYNVLFLGDAGNDAQVISASDVGGIVAHAAGHEGAQQGASFVLHGQNLSALLDLFEVSRRTHSNIQQNLIFSFIYNAVAVLLPMTTALAVGFILSPAIGAALMIVQTLIIFLNVYRFQSTPVHTKQVNQSSESCSPRDFNTDVFSVSNGMRLVHTNTNQPSNIESLFQAVDDQQGNVFN